MITLKSWSVGSTCACKAQRRLCNRTKADASAVPAGGCTDLRVVPYDALLLAACGVAPACTPRRLSLCARPPQCRAGVKASQRPLTRCAWRGAQVSLAPGTLTPLHTHHCHTERKGGCGAISRPPVEARSRESCQAQRRRPATAPAAPL